jgi:pimeloyl-ACP methyl ester carboxylesterase
MSTMTVVLVHGNPETEAIWNPLVDAVGRDDVVRVSPPGFGAPLPDDFPATYLAYRDWLEDELAGFDEPVDVVGHNWGGGHVLNTVMHRPELVRSWASDVVGVFDPDYIWHDLAQVWQTPGDGEQLVDTMMGGTVQGGPNGWPPSAYPWTSRPRSPRPRVRRWVGRSCCCTARRANPQWPRPAASWRPPRLGRACHCWPPRTTTSAPRRAADRAGARTEVLDGLGHWWMCQDPVRGAAVLTRFWETLD